MGFKDLSNEVVLNIFQQADRSTLPKIASCSRLFYDLVQPILYSSVIDSSDHTIALLLRTLSAKPHLAKLVRSYTSQDPPRHEFGRIDLSQLSLDSNVRALFPLEFFPRRVGRAAWRRLLCANENWDIVTALLLSLFTNLETLRLKIPVEERLLLSPQCYLFPMLRRVAAAQKRQETGTHLPHLREIVVLTVPTQVLWFPTILRFLEFQSVKKLVLNNILPWELPYSQPYTFNTPAINIEQTAGDTSSRNLSSFLGCFASLQRLRIAYIGHEGSVGHEGRRDFVSPVVTGLERSAHTLEELVIINRVMPLDFRRTAPRVYLAKLPKLKRVNIPGFNLLGTDDEDSDKLQTLLSDGTPTDTEFAPSPTTLRLLESIPPNIEHLALSFPRNFRLLACLVPLVKAKKLYLPKLVKIQVLLGRLHGDVSYYLEDEGILKTACVEYGVELVVVRNNLPVDSWAQ